MKHTTFRLLILALITTGLSQKVWDWNPKPWVFVRCTPTYKNETTQEVTTKNVTIAMHSFGLKDEELMRMFDQRICTQVPKPKSKHPTPTRRPARPTTPSSNSTNTTTTKP